MINRARLIWLRAVGEPKPCTQPTNTTRITAMCAVMLSKISWIQPLNTPCAEVEQ